MRCRQTPEKSGEILGFGRIFRCRHRIQKSLSDHAAERTRQARSACPENGQMLCENQSDAGRAGGLSQRHPLPPDRTRRPPRLCPTALEKRRIQGRSDRISNRERLADGAGRMVFKWKFGGWRQKTLRQSHSHAKRSCFSTKRTEMEGTGLALHRETARNLQLATRRLRANALRRRFRPPLFHLHA